jgi:hypothetical protein
LVRGGEIASHTGAAVFEAMSAYCSIGPSQAHLLMLKDNARDQECHSDFVEPFGSLRVFA